MRLLTTARCHWHHSLSLCKGGNAAEVMIAHPTTAYKSRKGFGFHVRQARARPSNVTVRELLSDGRYTGAVLDFLEKTKVGEVKAGVICR